MCVARRAVGRGSKGRSPKSFRKLIEVRSAQLLNPRSRTISVLRVAQSGLSGHSNQDHLRESPNRVRFRCFVGLKVSGNGCRLCFGGRLTSRFIIEPQELGWIYLQPPAYFPKGIDIRDPAAFDSHQSGWTDPDCACRFSQFVMTSFFSDEFAQAFERSFRHSSSFLCNLALHTK